MPRETISASHLTSVEQLNGQVKWDEFELPMPNGQTLSKRDFVLAAVGTPNREAEKWDIEVKDARYNTQQDLIYVLVVAGRILKIGKSITTMKKRIESYHCGKNAYRLKQNATNSATNWFILQSVIAMDKPVYIYVLYIPSTQGEFMGWGYQNRVSKEIEGKVISEFVRIYGSKPIGNKQT